MDIYPTLTGSHIRLRPLQADDGPALLQAASDGELWQLKFTVVPSQATMAAYIATALEARAAGMVIPFVTEDISSGKVIGSTRYWKVDARNRQLEIGHTWLAASWQRTRANSEAKYLMLRHAFDTLGMIRVQFTTDELNTRSQAAILRLGARLEGLIRYERIMPDGRKRNSLRYSIIEDEWPEVCAGLLARLAQGEIAGA
ncbi:GNAT family N-acetyltransferase [Andreprevotia lacus]|nr:GNAT family protein [Andreprevotia lacus]